MSSIRQISTASTVKTISVKSVEQARRIDEAIARRAYEIFERRAGIGRHELRDWREAESEVRSKLCFSLGSSDDSVLVGFDLARFEKDGVEVWVAPRQITICGKPTRHKEQPEWPAHSYGGPVFRVIALPVEVDAGRAVANVKRCFAEIRLPMIHPKYEERSRALAA